MHHSALPSRAAIVAALLAVTLLLAVALALNAPWSLAYASDDAAYFDLAHRFIHEGATPYRDLFILHTPLHYWVVSLASALFGPEAGQMVAGVCVAWLLGISLALAALHVAASLAASPLKATTAAVIAALAASPVVGWDRVLAFVPYGGRPNLLALALVTLAAVSLMRRSAAAMAVLLAGALLSWQVSAVFALVLCVTALLWLSRAAIRPMALGLFLPGAAAVAALAVGGAFEDFIRQAVLFPLIHQVRPVEARAGESDLGMTLFMMLRITPPALLIVTALGAIGAVMIWRTRRARADSLPGAAAIGLLAAGVIPAVGLAHGPLYALNMAGPAALLLAAVIGAGIEGLSCPWRRGAAISVTIAASAALVAVLPPAARPTRSEEAARYAALMDLAPSESMLIVGDPVMQAYLGAPLISRDLQWIHGRDRFLEATHAGGLAGYARSLLASEPVLVYIAPRADALREAMGDVLDRQYVAVETLTVDERPVYLRREPE